MPALNAAVFIKAVVENGEVIMKKNAIKFINGLFLIFCSFSLHAANSRMDSADLFDSILEKFHQAAHTWSHTLINYASWLFWSLALISMVWTFGFMALQKEDIQAFFSELLKFITTLGFFYWLLLSGPSIATAIMDSLRQLAAEAGHIDYHISPSAIVDVGFEIVAKAIENSSLWSPAATTVGLILSGIILTILTLVSLNMLVVLISAWVITFAGIFLLGFGGGRWTQDIAINYYRCILGIALEAFTMILIVGIGKSFLDEFYVMMSQDVLLKEMFIMLVVGITLLTLVNKIPPMVSGLVQGGGGFGGGPIGGGGGGGIAPGALMGAATVAAGAAGATMNAAFSQVAGGTSALSAAFKAAAQTMGGDSGSIFGSSDSTSKLGGLANAMGQATKFAGHVGAHLASGATDVAKDKLGSVKNALTDKSSATIGGKVASAISSKPEGDNAEENSTESTQTTNEANTSQSNTLNASSNSDTNVNPAARPPADVSGGAGSGEEVSLPDVNEAKSKEA